MDSFVNDSGYKTKCNYVQIQKQQWILKPEKSSSVIIQVFFSQNDFAQKAKESNYFKWKKSGL